MSNLPPDIVTLVEADKTLGRSPTWDSKAVPRYFSFVAPLTVGEITTGGFELRMRMSQYWPDRDAMAQLEFAPAGRRSATELWRLDWKRHPHTNKGRPKEFAYHHFNGSHEHTFEDNYLASENRMLSSGSLPAARPFPWEPITASEFLAFCGERFRIKDISLITLPPLTADLFWAPP